MRIRVIAKPKDQPEIEFGGQFQEPDIFSATTVESFLEKATGKTFMLSTFTLSHSLDSVIFYFTEREF